MSGPMLVSTVLITLALLFYSIGVGPSVWLDGSKAGT